jgi:hypothetical protein
MTQHGWRRLAAVGVIAAQVLLVIVAVALFII